MEIYHHQPALVASCKEHTTWWLIRSYGSPNGLTRYTFNEISYIKVPQYKTLFIFIFRYVIIKYWYGNNSKNYYHWIDVLGLSEPAERNWIGEEKVYISSFICM